MRKILPGLLFLCSCGTGPHVKWTVFQNTKERFSVSLPEGYVQREGMTLQTVWGELPAAYAYWRNPSWQIKDLGVKLLEVSCYEIPSRSAEVSREKIIDSCLQRWMDVYQVSSKGRLISAENVSAGTSCPGKQIRACVDVGKGDSLIVMIVQYVSGNKVYSLHANGYRKGKGAVSMDRFLRSFKLK